MKKNICLLLAFAALLNSAHALTLTFSPTPANLNNLDHINATSWGLAAGAIPVGQTITGATLKISQIWDWKLGETDYLFIRLLDNPALGVKTFVDNTNDNVYIDYFAGQGVALTTWSDPIGGLDGRFATDLTYTFTTSQLATLSTYMSNATPAGMAAFGFGFDPDCHYFNNGVTFTVTTTTASVPDAGSTGALLGLGVLALGWFRRRGAA